MATTALRRVTWLDVVRQELGQWVPDDVAGYILWNDTAFPFANEDYIRRQVREFRARRANDAD